MLRRIFIIASKKWILITALVFTVGLFFLLRKIDNLIAGNAGMGVVYLQFAFIEDYFIPVVASWGTRGIDIFLQTIWLDFIFPVCYATLLSSFYAGIVINKNNADPTDIARGDLVHFLIPVIAALFDFIENGLHIFILSLRWYFNPLIATASLASLIKWSLLAYMILAIIRQHLKQDRRTQQ